MKVLTIQDEEGQYIGEDNKRYNLIICSWVQGPRASEFKEFDTLEYALEYYGLTDPNAPISVPEANNEVSEEQGEEENDEEGNEIEVPVYESRVVINKGWDSFNSLEEAMEAYGLTDTKHNEPLEEE